MLNIIAKLKKEEMTLDLVTVDQLIHLFDLLSRHWLFTLLIQYT